MGQRHKLECPVIKQSWLVAVAAFLIAMPTEAYYNLMEFWNNSPPITVQATQTVYLGTSASGSILPVYISGGSESGRLRIISKTALAPAITGVNLTISNALFGNKINVTTSTTTGSSTFTYLVEDDKGARATVTVTLSVVSSTFWTGANNNGLWSDAGNWSTGVVPGAGVPIYFDNAQCSTHCNVTVDTPATALGIFMNTGYTGTITQSTQTMTVGASGWTQNAGTFAGGSASISISGDVSIAGGTFTSTSNTLSIIGSFTMSTGTTFNANNGTVSFGGTGAYQVKPLANTNFYNLTFAGGAGNDYAIKTAFNVNNNLTLANTDVNSGKLSDSNIITVKGTVTVTNYGYRGSSQVRGSPPTTAVTWTTTAATIPYFPKVTLASASPARKITINGDMYADNTFSTNTNSILTSTNLTMGCTGTPGALNLNNLTYASLRIACTYTTFPFNTTTDAIITGDVTIGNSTRANKYTSGVGTLHIKGNLIVVGKGGSGVGANFRMECSANRTVDVSGATSGFTLPSIEVACGSNTLNFTGPATFAGSYIVTSGTVTGTTGFTFATSVGGTLSPGAATYTNVTLSGNYNSTTGVLQTSGPITIDPSFYWTGTMLIGVSGDLSVSGPASTSGLNFIINGSGTQNINTSTLPNGVGLTIASTGGPVNFNGSVSFTSNFTYTSGTTNLTSKQVTFAATLLSTVINTGSLVLANPIFAGYGTVTGTILTSGDVTIQGGGYYYGGEVSVVGNLVTGPSGFSSPNNSTMPTVFSLNGTANQNVDVTTSPNVGYVKFNSTGGSVSFVGNTPIFKSGYEYAQGVVNLGAMTLNLGGAYAWLKLGPSTFSNTFYLNGVVTVLGVARISGLINCDRCAIAAGTIEAEGDFNMTNGFFGSNVLAGVVKFIGTGSQYLTSVTSTAIPAKSFEFAKAVGTAYIIGTFSPGTGDNFTYTSGTVDATACDLEFGIFNSVSWDSGPIVFRDLLVSISSSPANAAITGTIFISRNLYLEGDGYCSESCNFPVYLNGGSVSVAGDILSSVTATGNSGTTQIQLTGSSSTTWTRPPGSSIPTGNITINKTGGATVTLDGAQPLAASQTLTINSGTLLMNGNNLTIPAAAGLTLGAGTTVTRGGGVLTVNGSTVNAGPYSGGTVN